MAMLAAAVIMSAASSSVAASDRSAFRRELQLLEQCGREGSLCLSQARLSQHAEDVRRSAEAREVTIVLNHWQRPADNLFRQLKAAVASEAREVWVCLFGSAFAAEYLEAVDRCRESGPSGGEKIRVIRSDVDFGVHGRFLLASSARTRYVYIVDDDVAFPVSVVAQYLEHSARQRGVWGHAGHVRHPDAERAKWVVRPRKPAVVDYANAAWFLETAVIAGAFLREPPPSRLTGEDIHLSHMARRVLGLETRVVGWRRDSHPDSRYTLQMTDATTLTPSIFNFRSFLARSQLSRGPTMRQPPALDALAFVETAEEAEEVARRLRSCSAPVHGACDEAAGPLCGARSEHLGSRRSSFVVALLLSGLQQGAERRRTKAAAAEVCARLSSPPCSFVPYELCGAVCASLEFARVSWFDLQAGAGLGLGGEGAPASPPTAAVAADVLEAAAGLLSTLQITHLFVFDHETLMRSMVLHGAALANRDRSPKRQFEVVALPSGAACRQGAVQTSSRQAYGAEL